MTEAEPAHVCLLMNGETLSAWAVAAVHRMVAETDAEISLVVSKQVDIADATTWGAVRCRLFDASEDMLDGGVRRLE